MALAPWGTMAGPFTRKDFEKLVPSDKKLSPEWLRSLTERGERAVYRGEELGKIGMPIGGLCAGQVYLGGDGRLWHWDIFNRRISTGAEHYAKPLTPDSPFLQRFVLRFTAGEKTEDKPLDRDHWKEVSFNGEYPIGTIDYRDPDVPVTVRLEAFSPFIPMETEDSSLPATILNFRVTNPGTAAVPVELGGWLENPVCLYSSQTRDGHRRNRLLRRNGLLLLECSAEAPPKRESSGRPDIVFEDFESPEYRGWTATGVAFGTGPAELSKVPPYQGELGASGRRAVNTHATSPGDAVEARDSATGTLTSREFRIERDYITFLVGGGSHQGRTCMNLRVDNQAVCSATGRNDNRMHPVSWDVRRWVGKAGRLEIVDAERGPWGNVGVDDIIFSDEPRSPLGELEQEHDFGGICLGLAGARDDDTGNASLSLAEVPAGVFAPQPPSAEPVRKRFGERLAGSLSRRVVIPPGGTEQVTFLICWHFPNLKLDRLPPRRHYATRFNSAVAVAEYVAANLQRLASLTRLWHETWYDSTLPYWFLDRTFLNTSILATSTCYRFEDGRFYGWEGVGCCEGTCGHVWQYAHAVARLFPDLERATREKVDFGLAMQADGAIHFRGEFNKIPAIDAQAGTILRALREHQHSKDDSFLKRNWRRIRLATEWLMAKDANSDGLIEGNQHNTLDTDWFGPVAWLSGLYVAALLAAAQMAEESGDQDFAARCRDLAEKGRRRILADLFDGEYFFNKPDPKHLDAINSGSGCHIDQVFGQSWAFQVGLERVLPAKETLSALRSLWRYNFTPDVGPYRKAYQPGRWYAMPGEAGLLMCTFPREDWDYAQAKGKGPEWAAGYFNECMNGFEYQAAGHMIWEGMLTEGLAITRAVHDRYHPSRRNPWNEVECGDHYARSMASYGVYLAACGYGYHGPKGWLKFAPRLSGDEFKCAFTTAEGWGSYHCSKEQRAAGLELRFGHLRLRHLEISLPAAVALEARAVRVELDEQTVAAEISLESGALSVRFAPAVSLSANSRLTIRW